VTGGEQTSTPRNLTDPVGTVVDVVAQVEATLSREVVENAIAAITSGRAQRQRLAKALHEDSGLLTSGTPDGPPTVAALIYALQAAGATRLRMPRCPICSKTNPLTQRDDHGRRICGGCWIRLRETWADCSRCGNHRRAIGRDRTGLPLCRCCPPDPGVDHAMVIAEQIARVARTASVTDLRVIVETAVRHPSQRRQVAWELEDRPDLLTGAGAHGSARVEELIAALVERRIPNITPLRCPFCQRTVRLRSRRDGQRSCKKCYQAGRTQVCCRCRQDRVVARRTLAGEPLCTPCARSEPENHAACTDCGRVRPIVRRDGEQAWCKSCGPGRLRTCVICGQRKRCHFFDTDSPRCQYCLRRLTGRARCSRCGRDKIVAARTPEGAPLCGNCIRTKESCSQCGKVRDVAHRSGDGGAICQPCYQRDPISFRQCSNCGSLERLHHHGLCARCAAPRVLTAMLAGHDDQIHPALQPTFDALLNNEPRPLLLWLTKPAPRRVLGELRKNPAPVTHELLDQLSTGTGHDVARLRSVLTNAGVLPPRDKQLANLERWLDRTLNELTDPAEHRIVRNFANWTHLRRLRRYAERHTLTPNQVHNTYSEINKTIELLTWLRNRGRTLGTCTQSDIDDWLHESGKQIRPFILWATKQGHAHNIEIPARRSNISRRGLEAAELRWSLARQLLHDDSINDVDRVVGLLVLFYAQPVTRISLLTVDQIAHDRHGVHIKLGTEPIDLPEPLSDLVLRLVNNRQGHAVIGHTNDHKWLFPGGDPGQPLGALRLAARLRSLGIPPRRSRNTALISLAADMPSAVLSRLLGISIDTANNWTTDAGNTRSGYAAELARRTRRSTASRRELALEQARR
jgi:hypothetical protein